LPQSAIEGFSSVFSFLWLRSGPDGRTVEIDPFITPGMLALLPAWSSVVALSRSGWRASAERSFFRRANSLTGDLGQSFTAPYPANTILEVNSLLLEGYVDGDQAIALAAAFIDTTKDVLRQSRRS
jgi:hypothetical protein